MALIYLIVKGACKVEFTCKVKVTCESYHCILQVNQNFDNIYEGAARNGQISDISCQFPDHLSLLKQL